MSKMQSEPQINSGPNTDVSKIYKNVMSMIGEVIGDDVDFVAALERHRRDRRLVKSLAVIRARAVLT